MARRRITRSVGGNREQSWIGVIAEDLTVDDTPVVEVALVSGADWAAAAGLSRATLLRIRGWFSLNVASDVETTEGTFFCGVYVTDVDAPVLTVGTNDPASSSFFLEDILWTWGRRLPASNASAVTAQPSYWVDVDIHAMRKLTSDQQVRFAMVVGTPAIVVNVSSTMRSLVRSGS